MHFQAQVAEWAPYRRPAVERPGLGYGVLVLGYKVLGSGFEVLELGWIGVRGFGAGVDENNVKTRGKCSEARALGLYHAGNTEKQ